MEQTVKSLPDHTSYRIVGSGEPLMLLHGFGEAGDVWDQQVNSLSYRYQCIVPDLPGTGMSRKAFDTLPEQSLEVLADKMKEIAEQESISQFTLFGHSMGGYTALAFAEKYPDMLGGLGLIHSSAYADSVEKINTRNRSIKFIREQGPVKFLEQMIPALYADGFREQHPEVVEEHLKNALAFDAEVLIAYYQMMIRRPDRTQVLVNAQIPVLFIMGTEDKAVNLSDSLAQCYLPAESHVEILESSGHMGMKENQERTTIAMKKFLAHLNEN